MSIKLAAGLLTMTLSAGFAIPATAQEILPFPPKPSGSTAARTMQESIYVRSHRRITCRRMRRTSSSCSSTMSGLRKPTLTAVKSIPTLTKIANEGSPTTGFTPPRCVRPLARLC